MSVELHLPDLPEVPIALGPEPVPPGPARGRATLPWTVRLRDALTAYLPLLLMALLALATWWLVKHTPQPAAPSAPVAQRAEPDYTMRRFTMERFDPDGRLRLRLEGDEMHHYPDTDRIEVLGVRIRAWSPDGRQTTATATRALGNGDGSEVQLIGGAEVLSQASNGQTLQMRSDFLHLFLVTERVRTHLPVDLRYAGTDIHAAGLDYDNKLQRLDFRGPLRAVLAPRVSAPTAVTAVTATPAATTPVTNKKDPP